MIKINIPEELTDLLALGLLNETLPEEIEYEDIVDFDFEGKDAITERRNYKEGFIYKAAAALGYEDFKDTKNIAYCYSRALTSALRYNLPLAANVCAGRALSIYPYLLVENEGEADNVEGEIFKYIPNKIAVSSRVYRKLYSERRPKKLNEYEHNWFTTIKDTISA